MGEGTPQRVSPAPIRPSRQHSFANTARPRGRCPAPGTGFGENARASSTAAHAKHHFTYPKPASSPRGRQNRGEKPVASPRADTKAERPQGPVASGLDYVLDTRASSKSGAPCNVLMQIIIISISSVNAIAIIAVMTQAGGHRQQFLCNTATKRHPCNTTDPNTARTSYPVGAII